MTPNPSPMHTGKPGLSTLLVKSGVQNRWELQTRGGGDRAAGTRQEERRGRVDPASGYRNGYGKKRRLTLSSGTITVRRPRVRDLEERFESRVLPLFAKRTQQVRDLIPELYLHGLAQGDFDLALRGLLGEEAALSANTVARLKEKWQGEWAG